MSERLRLWLERAERGYHLRDAATGEPVRWEDTRIRVIAAAGVTFRPESLEDPSFDPGRRLELVPEPRTSTTRTRSESGTQDRTLQVGYVPAAVAPEVAGDEQAVSLWRVDGGLRVLLAPADAWIGLPGRLARRWRTSSSCPTSARASPRARSPAGSSAEGQELAEDDPLVEIQTDKTTVEIPSPAAGTVTKILVGEGEVVPVGTVLVVIGGAATEPAAAPLTPARARKCSCTHSFWRARSRPGHPDRAPDRPGIGRRSGFVERYGAERPHHRGRRSKRRRGLSVTGTQSCPRGGASRCAGYGA